MGTPAAVEKAVESAARHRLADVKPAFDLKYIQENVDMLTNNIKIR